MAKKELTPEQIAENAAQELKAKEAAEKAAQEMAEISETECMYCGSKITGEDVFTDAAGNSFCSVEHAEIYAQTMRTINNTY